MNENGAATVADMTHCASPQHEHIAILLAEAGREEGSGYPQGFTHRELACLIYDVKYPSSAQLSAIRRSVARLVADGRAERDGTDRRLNGWDRNAGYHERVRASTGEPYICRNAAGILIHRPWTAEDHKARAAVLARHGLAYDHRGA